MVQATVAGETIFRILFGVLLLAMMLVRHLYEQRMRVTAAQGLARDEDTRQTLARHSLPIMISQWVAIVYLTKPAWVIWGSLPFPHWLRWLGAGLALLGTGLLIWTHQALDRNFFGGLKIREGHELVTWGPYRWVQHPMYGAFFVLGLGYLFLSANLLIGLPWLLGTVLIAAYRVGREEAILESHFGDPYRAYLSTTGRFLPRLRPRR